MSIPLCSLCGGLALLLAGTAPFAADDTPPHGLLPWSASRPPHGPSTGPATTGSAPHQAGTPPGAIPQTVPPQTVQPQTLQPHAVQPEATLEVAPPPAVTPEAAAPAAPEAACIETPSCIDDYLWSVYRRTPTGFSWKDTKAAGKVGMSPMEFVIGGMDPAFRVTLYRALRTLDVVGFMPGITCGFRDDYRQSITTGKRARNDRSFHGGSAHGGYGHGQAADIVSVKDGATNRMYAFIDHHERELGIGRPYLRGDPPHVAPVDGEEFAIHRPPLPTTSVMLPPN